MDTDCFMYDIKLTDEFNLWLRRLKDHSTRIRLARRLEKASRGLLGDVKPVGDGLYEMREYFGPGWRMYYVQRGTTLIIMLAGGDKSTQSRDIELAKQRATKLDEAT